MPLLVLLLALVLVGCERDTPQAVLDNYAQRVANTLDMPLSERADNQLHPLPDRRNRRMPVPEIRAGLLDALELADCGLLPLISERNSILGKVKRPSAVLDYELRFFERLEQCYRQDQEQPIADAEFSDYLRELYHAKKSSLFAVFWNAVFTSEELERNLSLSRPPIPLSGNPGYGDSLRALQALSRYQHSILAVSNGELLQQPALNVELETHYFALYASEFGSQLNTSLDLLTGSLNQVASTLEDAIARRPLCLTGQPVAKARYLRNVFDQFYAGEVQPYMAQIQRLAPPWLEEMTQLAGLPEKEASTEAPKVMLRYQRRMLSTKEPDGIWQQYQRAISRHTKAWQAILRQCGLMPSAN